MTTERIAKVTTPDGKEPFAPQPRDRENFPLFLRFEIEREGAETLYVSAGFRNWPHYLAYVDQCWQRNGVRIRRPVQLDEVSH